MREAQSLGYAVVLLFIGIDSPRAQRGVRLPFAPSAARATKLATPVLVGHSAFAVGLRPLPIPQ